MPAFANALTTASRNSDTMTLTGGLYHVSLAGTWATAAEPRQAVKLEYRPDSGVAWIPLCSARPLIALNDNQILHIGAGDIRATLDGGDAGTDVDVWVADVL